MSHILYRGSRYEVSIDSKHGHVVIEAIVRSAVIYTDMVDPDTARDLARKLLAAADEAQR